MRADSIGRAPTRRDRAWFSDPAGNVLAVLQQN